MSKRIYGYIRVSTKEQNIDRQCISMQEFGVPSQNIYIDRQSGKDFDRPAYQQMVSSLRPGDTLVMNIKTPHLIQSQTRVQTSEMLATKGFVVFCCPADAPFCQQAMVA